MNKEKEENPWWNRPPFLGTFPRKLNSDVALIVDFSWNEQFDVKIISLVVDEEDREAGLITDKGHLLGAKPLKTLYIYGSGIYREVQEFRNLKELDDTALSVYREHMERQKRLKDERVKRWSSDNSYRGGINHANSAWGD